MGIYSLEKVVLSDKIIEAYFPVYVSLVLGNFRVVLCVTSCWFANKLLPEGKYKVQVRFAFLSAAVLIWVSNHQLVPAADIFEAFKGIILRMLSQ